MPESACLIELSQSREELFLSWLDLNQPQPAGCNSLTAATSCSMTLTLAPSCPLCHAPCHLLQGRSNHGGGVAACLALASPWKAWSISRSALTLLTKSNRVRAKEMAQGLNAHTALTEYPNSVPSTHTWAAHNCLEPSSKGI